MSQKTEFKHGAQYMLMQIVATPGLVLLLLSWLMIVLYVIYEVAVNTNTVQTYAAPGPPEPASSGVSFEQLVVATALSLVLWYVIGFGVHWGLAKVADNFVDAKKAYQILTLGGTVLGAAIMAIGGLVVSSDIGFVFGVLLGGLFGTVGLISFGLQQLLAKLWNIELV